MMGRKKLNGVVFVDIKDKWWVNRIDIVVIVIFIFLITFVREVCASQPVISISPYNRPLESYAIPSQLAQANSNFSFNLKPYFSRIEPEIDLVITNNNAQHPFAALIDPVPNGLSRFLMGQDMCPESIVVGTKKSCFLRYWLDKAHYRAYSPALYFGLNQGCLVLNYSAEKEFNRAVATAPGPTQISVTPVSQNGLSYDPQTASIVGKPTRIGTYQFIVNATNGVMTAAPQTLTIQVDANLRDKPIFKPYYTLLSAMPEREYRINLLDLIELDPSFMETNQVQFRIDMERDHPEWLSIDSNNPTVLRGVAPQYESGQKREVTVIASSNTGGDSEPFTIKIPVAYDLCKKPVLMQNIELTGAAGIRFQHDFRTDILNLIDDNSLKLTIDNIVPAAPWLSVSSINPTELIGVVPMDMTGQTYQLTVYANSAIGGNSDPVIISLKIDIDKSLTPHFYLDKPQLPPLQLGQPYFYDFKQHEEVYPRYEDIPYHVELAKNYPNPPWFHLENNHILIDKVPENIHGDQKIYLIIQNIPGGMSDVLEVNLPLV